MTFRLPPIIAKLLTQNAAKYSSHTAAKTRRRHALELFKSAELALVSRTNLEQFIGHLTIDRCVALELKELVQVLHAAAALEHRDSCLLEAVEESVAGSFADASPRTQADILWIFAKLQWRTELVLKCVGQAISKRSGMLSGCTTSEISNLVWAYARLDYSGATALPAYRDISALALHQVGAFSSTDLARLAASLCRLSAFDETWTLYARAQRVLPGVSGAQELRAVMISASERAGHPSKVLSILTHLAILPRVARSPTWRVVLAGAAVLHLWQCVGTDSAAEAYSMLPVLHSTKSPAAAALRKRLERLSRHGVGSTPSSKPALDSTIGAALRTLKVSLQGGAPNKAADKRKEFALLRHVSTKALPLSAEAVLREMEVFASLNTFLKLAGGVKRRLLERVVQEAPQGLVVELGTYIGYSATVLAMMCTSRRSIGSGPANEQRPVHVVSVELDPVNGLIARHILNLAGLASEVEVWMGNSGDAARYVRDRFGKRSVAVLFMDHRGSLFHEDLQSFQALDLFIDGGSVVADNVLKPGAPRFLWHVSHSASFTTDLIALPEFGLGHQALEDWMAVCRYRGGTEHSEPPACPAGIVALADECDAIRRKTLLRKEPSGGVSLDEWAEHAAAMKDGLREFGIMATVTDGEQGQ